VSARLGSSEKTRALLVLVLGQFKWQAWLGRLTEAPSVRATGLWKPERGPRPNRGASRDSAQ